MRLIAVFKFTIVRSRFIFVFPNLMVALNCLTNTLNLVGYYLALVPLLTPLPSGRVIMLIVRVNWRPMAPPPNGRATYTSTSTSTGNRGQDIKRRGFINPKRVVGPRQKRCTNMTYLLLFFCVECLWRYDSYSPSLSAKTSVFY